MSRRLVIALLLSAVLVLTACTAVDPGEPPDILDVDASPDEVGGATVREGVASPG